MYKYLKYKKKYIEIKGGSSSSSGFDRRTKKIFNLYTTGITNWNQDDIINAWNNYFRNHVLNLIGKKYSIQIFHYDPMLSYTESDKLTTKKKELESKLLNPKFKIRDYDYTESIIIDIIDFESIKDKTPYLIIDFAHIFSYLANIKNDPTGSIIVCDSLEYDETVFPEKQILPQSINLNVLYPGYLGIVKAFFPKPDELSERQGDKGLSYCKLFIIDENDCIITYINKLIEGQFIFKSPEVDKLFGKYAMSQQNYQKYPHEVIEKIASQIDDHIKTDFKELKKLDIIEYDKIIRQTIINLLMDKTKIYNYRNIDLLISDAIDILRKKFKMSSSDEKVDKSHIISSLKLDISSILNEIKKEIVKLYSLEKGVVEEQIKETIFEILESFEKEISKKINDKIIVGDEQIKIIKELSKEYYKSIFHSDDLSSDSKERLKFDEIINQIKDKIVKKYVVNFGIKPENEVITKESILAILNDSLKLIRDETEKKLMVEKEIEKIIEDVATNFYNSIFNV